VAVVNSYAEELGEKVPVGVAGIVEGLVELIPAGCVAVFAEVLVGVKPAQQKSVAVVNCYAEELGEKVPVAVAEIVEGLVELIPAGGVAVFAEVLVGLKSVHQDSVTVVNSYVAELVEKVPVAAKTVEEVVETYPAGGVVGFAEVLGVKSVQLKPEADVNSYVEELVGEKYPDEVAVEIVEELEILPAGDVARSVEVLVDAKSVQKTPVAVGN